MKLSRKTLEAALADPSSRQSQRTLMCAADALLAVMEPAGDEEVDLQATMYTGHPTFHDKRAHKGHIAGQRAAEHRARKRADWSGE